MIAEDSTALSRTARPHARGEGIDVVGEARNAHELQTMVQRERPDVALVDVRMPPTHTDEGTRTAKGLKQELPDLGVLVLSQVVETKHALDLFSEHPEGFGYLLKDRVTALDEFLDALRVAAGGTAIDPEVVGQLMGRRRERDPLEELTPREREVLGLMAEGLSNHGICDRLFLSPKTIETHVKSIFTKLGLVAPAPDDHRRVLAVLAFLGA